MSMTRSYVLYRIGTYVAQIFEIPYLTVTDMFLDSAISFVGSFPIHDCARGVVGVLI